MQIKHTNMQIGLYFCQFGLIQATKNHLYSASVANMFEKKECFM